MPGLGLVVVTGVMQAHQAWGVVQARDPYSTGRAPGEMYRNSDGTLAIQSKTIPLVAGETLRFLWDMVSQKVSSLVGRVTKPALQSAASDCYDSIAADHPSMNPDSQDVVQAICSGASEVDVESVNLDDEGVRAIGEAIGSSSSLQALMMSGVYCDTPTLATAFSDALLRSGSLQTLDLHLGDKAVTPVSPSPMQSSALETFAGRLPYFKLTTLRLGTVRITDRSAQALVNAFQGNAAFPLEEFGFTWSPTFTTDAQIGAVIRGFGGNQCLQTLNLGMYTGLSLQGVIDLVQMLPNTTISTVILQSTPIYTFTKAQEQAILDAVGNSTCLQSITTSGHASPFSPALTANITKAIANRPNGTCVRGACVPKTYQPTAAPTFGPTSDPTAAPTSEPTPEAAPAQSSSNSSPSMLSQIGVPIGTALLGALAGFWCGRRRRQAEQIEGDNQQSVDIGAVSPDAGGIGLVPVEAPPTVSGEVPGEV